MPNWEHLYWLRYVDEFYKRVMRDLGTDDRWQYTNEGQHYMPNWYKTTSQEATASRKVLEEAAAARLPSRDVFLARLAEAEKAD